MSFKRIDQKKLQALNEREQQLQRKIKQREEEQRRVNSVFLEHVKKELDLLMTQKENMDRRNQKYLHQIKNYSKEFNRILPELLEAEEKLTKAKLQYQRVLEKEIK